MTKNSGPGGIVAFRKRKPVYKVDSLGSATMTVPAAQIFLV
jgi:hypothetical protein